MAIYKTKFFEKLASQADLSDQALCRAIKEIQDGLLDADLGGGLFKKRIARSGKGKSGGYRTLIVSNKKGLWFFVFVYPKNVQSNLDANEEKALKLYAAQLLSLKPAAIDGLINTGKLIRVICDEKKAVFNP